MKKVLKPFVLSGGGARGFAHLGVLKACAEKNIYPQAIAATSAGSIAAAFLCDGYNTDEVKEIFLKSKIGLSMQWKNWRNGLLSLNFVEQILKDNMRNKNFEELDTPLYIAATNFNTGMQMVFNRGPVIPAVLAASSIPILFHPVEINNIPFVDGGLSGNLPVEPLLADYHDIVGVHVNPLAPYNKKNGFLANVDRVLHMAMREAVLKNKKHCNYFIEPAGLENVGLFDFKRFESVYSAGLEYTRSFLQDAMPEASL